VSRQDGGEVDPSLFKETFSIGPENPSGDAMAGANLSSFAPTARTSTTSAFGQTGLNTGYYDAHPEEKAVALTPTTPGPVMARQGGGEVRPSEGDLLWQQKRKEAGWTDPSQDLYEHLSKGNVPPASPTPSLQSFAPEANLTSTGPPTPPTGMGEYKANARKIRGLPAETGTLTVNPTNKRLNQITGFLRSFMKPPAFKENRRSPIFGSDQRAVYDKKWKPFTDFMEGTKETPLFSRDRGGSTSPDPFEGLSEEERAKFLKLHGGHGNVVDLAPNASGTFEAKTTPTLSPDNMTRISNAGETTIPKTEPVRQIEGGVPRSLSEIKKDILPLGETRYTIGDEQGGITVPKGFTPGEGNLQSFANPELEERKKWATPGYREAQIAKRQKESDLESTKGGLPMSTVIGVSPGYEKTYYEAHPEERFMDLATAENKPLLDMYRKLIEENKMRAGGFGLPMDPKAARIIQAEATKAGPELTQGLEKMMALNQAIPEKYFSSETRAGKMGTPQLVQNEKGEYVHIYPPGTTGGKPTIAPTGVIGKGAAERSPTEWGLIAEAGEKGLDGKPTANAIKAQGILDSQEKRKQDIAGGGIPLLPENTPPRIKQTPAGPIDESALDGLSEDQKGIVRGLVTYKYPWPGSFAMSKPSMQRLIGRAERYDPSFSGPEYQVRQKVRQSFTSGKDKDNIVALNTAVGHINSLVKAKDELANSNWVTGNAAVNLLAKHFPVTEGLVARQGTVTGVKTKFNAVKGEMANIFKRSGATDQEIKSWNETVGDPTTATPTSWNAFISGALELMGSRIEALRNVYERGIGSPKDFAFLSPKSRTILKSLGVDVNAIDPVVGTATVGGAPAENRPRASDFGGNPEGQKTKGVTSEWDQFWE
jgi:hypothetical protein